jgi:ABC-type bacteriocin/lantibiotic exporter with double-glycine peptidase domain
MEIGLIIALTQYVTNMSMNLLDGIENIVEIANQLGILSHGINSIGREHHHKPATTNEDLIQANDLSYRNIRFPDFTIRNGETVLITGPSGSGKTTLLNLIAGLIKPDEGIMTNGIESNFGYLPQEISLFRNTLEYNLRYGAEGDLDQLIDNPLYNFVHKMPNGLKTVISESAVSAGEKQRIGLARCILSGGSILLLDEPFTRLDEENQSQVINLLYSIKSTKIIVTHNLSKIPEGFADRMIKLS